MPCVLLHIIGTQHVEGVGFHTNSTKHRADVIDSLTPSTHLGGVGGFDACPFYPKFEEIEEVFLQVEA